MTAAETTTCPGCGLPMARVVDRGVRYECSCGGRMLGLSPLERLLEPGVGARLWVASEHGSPAAGCPFCQLPMRQVPEDADGPADMAACRRCEQVWLPASMSAWLTTHAARADGASAPPAGLTHRCDNCGAPWQPDQQGRCRFCRAQGSAAEPVVVMMTPDRQAGGWLGA